MKLSTQTASHPIHDELKESLQHVVTALEQRWTDVLLRLIPISPPGLQGAERGFRLEGADDLSVRVRFGVYLLGDGTHEVYVGIEDGPTCRFTCDPDGTKTKTGRAELGRKVTALLLKEIEPRIGQRSGAAPTKDVPAPPEPQLVLDREGAIQDLNEGARDVLDYSEDEIIEANFFSHVHGRNLRRVMRDLAQMVSCNRQRARWLLRLRTGSDRWRWYRVSVLNRLPSVGEIQLRLRLLGAAGRARDRNP